MADPLSITASIVAVLQLATSATQYINTVKGGAAERLRLRDELRSAVALLEMLKDRAEDGDVDVRETWAGSIRALALPHGPLDQFREVLERLVKKLVTPGGSGMRGAKGVVQVLKWPFDKAEVLEALGAIERQKSLFGLALQNDHVRLSQSIREEVREVGEKVDELRIGQVEQQKRLRRENDEEVLDWISTLDFRAKQNDTIGRRQEGTGMWLLEKEEFRNWLSGRERVLWCPGIPGAGKTVFAAAILEYLEQNFASQYVGLAFVYCDHKEKSVQASSSLIASLLRQLVELKEEIPEVILESYKQRQKRKLRLKAHEYVDLLHSVATSFSRVFIVVDALDECDEANGSRGRLISDLEGLPPTVQVLHTSRFLPDLERRFVAACQVEIQASDEDVRTYLRNRIEQEGRLSKHVQADASLGDDIVAAIAGKVKGMFLLAQLHVEALAKKQTRKAVRLALNALPKGLDDTYEEILQRIESQDDDDVMLARQLLSWISFAKRPLKLSVVQDAIAAMSLEPEEGYFDLESLPEEDILLAVCAGIVTFEKESTNIRLVHYTTQEFFERRRDTVFPDGQIGIARACIRYMTLKDFLDLTPEEFPSTTIKDLPDTIYKDKQLSRRLSDYPLLRYAGQHWGDHARGPFEERCIDELIQFLHSKTAIRNAIQVRHIPPRRFFGWSQRYPRRVPAIVLAASFGLSIAVQTLLDSGSAMEDTGSDGQTALIAAASRGHPSVVKRLLERGAHADAGDTAGETALMAAASEGHADVLDILLQAGVNVDQQTQDHWTALMAAAEHGREFIVKKLIGGGADVNVQSEDGETAPLRAARGGYASIIHDLLAAGAKVSAQTSEGRTAITIARNHDHEALIPILAASLSVTQAPSVRPTLRRMKPDTETGEGQTHIPGLGDSDLRQTSNDAPTYDQALRDELVGSGAFRQQYILDLPTIESVKPGEGLAKARSEIQSLTNLQHPSLIALEDVIDENEKIYLVFELASEGELFNWIVMKQKLTEPESKHVMLQIARGLKYIHDSGYIHCDIKPENVLVFDRLLTVKIADFGHAAMLQEDGTARFLEGIPVNYVAPEILDSTPTSRFTRAVDIWSLGVVLYICLCGFPPFSDELTTPEYPYTLAQQIRQGRFDYPSPYWDPIGDPALDLIDRMLTVDVGARINIEDCLAHEWMVVQS